MDINKQLQKLFRILSDRPSGFLYKESFTGNQQAGDQLQIIQESEPSLIII